MIAALKVQDKRIRLYTIGLGWELREYQPRIASGAAAESEFIQMRHGGGNAATRFVCGYLGCNKSTLRPLISALPRMACIPIGDGHAMLISANTISCTVPAIASTFAEGADGGGNSAA